MHRRVGAHRHRGVTLIEMLVAVGLLVLIASQAVPTSASLDTERLSAATGELRTILRQARSMALQSQSNVLVDMQVANEVSLKVGTCASPAATLTHPQTKGAYRVQLAALPGLAALQLLPDAAVTNGARWDGLMFDAQGQLAALCNLSGRAALSPKQPTAQIQLQFGIQQAAVRIQTVNGRVWSE